MLLAEEALVDDEPTIDLIDQIDLDQLLASVEPQTPDTSQPIKRSQTFPVTNLNPNLNLFCKKVSDEFKQLHSSTWGRVL